MQQLKLALIVTALLTGCAPVISDVCPTLFEYTDEFQAQTAAELELLPSDAALVRMLGDYGVVRAETRVCLGE